MNIDIGRNMQFDMAYVVCRTSWEVKKGVFLLFIEVYYLCLGVN